LWSAVVEVEGAEKERQLVGTLYACAGAVCTEVQIGGLKVRRNRTRGRNRCSRAQEGAAGCDFRASLNPKWGKDRHRHVCVCERTWIERSAASTASSDDMCSGQKKWSSTSLPEIHLHATTQSIPWRGSSSLLLRFVPGFVLFIDRISKHTCSVRGKGTAAPKTGGYSRAYWCPTQATSGTFSDTTRTY